MCRWGWISNGLQYARVHIAVNGYAPFFPLVTHPSIAIKFLAESGRPERSG